MTVEINIEWLSDYTDCECCGGSGAEGAIVTIGEDVIDMTPYAHCYNSVYYSESQVYNAILKHLGFVVNSTSNYNEDDY